MFHIISIREKPLPFVVEHGYDEIVEIKNGKGVVNSGHFCIRLLKSGYKLDPQYHLPEAQELVLQEKFEEALKLKPKAIGNEQAVDQFLNRIKSKRKKRV